MWLTVLIASGFAFVVAPVLWPQMVYGKPVSWIKICIVFVEGGILKSGFNIIQSVIPINLRKQVGFES